MKKISSDFLRMALWSYWAIFFVHLSSVSPVWGLAPDKTSDQYLYRSWTTREGFPQNMAQAAVQTRDGYLWIGTQAGLVRFNGQGFHVMTPENTPGLVSMQVTDLMESSDGDLWIATESGLTRTRDGVFDSWTHESHGLTRGMVTSLAEDHRGRIWIGATNQNLSIYDKGTLETLVIDATEPSIWVHSLLAARDQSVWVGTSVGLYRFAKGGQSEPRRYTHADGLPSLDVTEIFEDSDGSLYAGTSNGVVQLEGDRFTVPAAFQGLAGEFISEIKKDSDGIWWIGTMTRGLYRSIDDRLEKIGDILEREREIYSVFEDRENSLWVATGSNGLVQVRDTKLVTYKPHPPPLSNMTWAVMRDGRGNMWHGGDSGVVRINRDGSISRLDDYPGAPRGPVLALYEAGDGTIWVGSDGVGPLELKAGRFYPLSRKVPEMVGRRVRALYVDDDGRLLVGTRTRGLYIIDKGKVLEHYHEGTGLGSNRVVSITEAPDGRIFISTSVGLLLYRPGVGLERNWSPVLLPKVRIYTPSFDRDGNIWFGTMENGLFLLSSGKLHNFTTAHGLPGNTVFGIEQTERDLWMSGNSGLFRVSKDQLFAVADGKKSTFETEEFGTADGLYTPECNGGAQYGSARDPQGRLWFACMDGAVVVDPQDIPVNEVAPPVVIESAVAGKVSLEREGRVSYEDRRYEFKFAALSYVASEDAQILYKLEGYDDNWVVSGASRAAIYTNLSPREYRFRVNAANSDGIWNEDGAALSFVVAAPFYRKVWFWFLMALLFALTLTGLISWRIKAERKRTRELSELAWERTRGVLEGQVDAIRTLIADASNVSGDIQVLMDQLATSSEQVAAGVSETATTVGELERTGKASETNARRIVEAAKQTEDESIRGREVVDKSVRVMGEIQGASLKIVDEAKELTGRVAEVDAITTWVAEISEQSAVLSINAAIEASKAGEFGAGFGVVAENMQELATRSKEATLQIAAVLSSINDAIENISRIAVGGRDSMERGVSTIKQSGLIVGKLSDEMAENSALAQNIAQSIDQQIGGLNYIAKAVSEFSSTVDENKAISRNLALGSNKLGRSISNLLETIEGWKTPDFYR